jgi:hypothetical protein
MNTDCLTFPQNVCRPVFPVPFWALKKAPARALSQQFPFRLMPCRTVGFFKNSKGGEIVLIKKQALLSSDDTLQLIQKSYMLYH